MIELVSDQDVNERLRTAMMAARRLVTQSRRHVERSTAQLQERMKAASASTPCGIDTHSALNGRHLIAFNQRIEHIEAMCNALASHLSGLEVLIRHEVFHPLPAIPIARSIAEVSASCSWLLGRGLGAEERNARAYAAVFRSIESSIRLLGESDSSRVTTLRERLVVEVEAAGARVVRRFKKGVSVDEVAQVFVGRSHAKTSFQYSQRVAEEIPAVAGLYASMSGVAHGERLPTSTAWDTPDAFARVIGFVAYRATESWSRAVHAWVGVEPGPFANESDHERLIESMPSAHLREFREMTRGFSDGPASSAAD